MMDLVPLIGFRPTTSNSRNIKKKAAISAQGDLKASFKPWKWQEEAPQGFDHVFDAEILDDIEHDYYPLKSYKKALLLRAYSYSYIDLYV
ncbi:MAG: hypothetical protein ACD_73C00806G0006 [uncultured bacterium]|nr:MAG: hypothetical protein ACD_73C00806G0006 [uncultured bacterium]